MASLLFILLAISTPLLASEYLITTPLSAANYLALPDIDNSHQTAIFARLQEFPIGTEESVYKGVARGMAKELIDSEFLGVFPEEAHLHDELLKVLLDEDDSNDQHNKRTTAALWRTKKMLLFISRQTRNAKNKIIEELEAHVHSEEHAVHLVRKHATDSVFSYYFEKMLAIKSLRDFADVRDKGVKRLSYYNYFLSNPLLNSEDPFADAREDYYRTLKNFGVADPAALGDLP